MQRDERSLIFDRLFSGMRRIEGRLQRIEPMLAGTRKRREVRLLREALTELETVLNQLRELETQLMSEPKRASGIVGVAWTKLPQYYVLHMAYQRTKEAVMQNWTAVEDLIKRLLDS